MNIFYLSDDLQKCAEYTVDKHIVKMPLETAQLLCSAHHVKRSKLDIPYKETHVNHPSAIWTRANINNYVSLSILGLFLCQEYTYRYGKIHGCEEVIKWCLSNVPNLPNSAFFPPTPAMDDCFKITVSNKIDSVLSYRNYYRKGKKHLHSWKKRDIPSWL